MTNDKLRCLMIMSMTRMKVYAAGSASACDCVVSDDTSYNRPIVCVSRYTVCVCVCVCVAGRFVMYCRVVRC